MVRNCRGCMALRPCWVSLVFSVLAKAGLTLSRKTALKSSSMHACPCEVAILWMSVQATSYVFVVVHGSFVSVKAATLVTTEASSPSSNWRDVKERHDSA